MNAEKNYVEINKQSWNKRAEVHITSDFYNVDSFIKGKNSLNAIELDLLGDVSGKKILHLQCHFGQDTISLSKMGAIATGIDLSDTAIDQANALAKKMNVNTSFVCCNVYDLAQYVNEKFDIVFTTYGTIGWLPDLDKWAKLIAEFLKPGGKLVFAEFHPVVWMFNSDFTTVSYNYFNDGAIVETESGTYTDRNADITQQYVSWNHGLAEVFTSLIKNGLTIHAFNEFDYSPYNCFNGTVEYEPGKFRIKSLGNKIPMVYSLMATKK